MPPKRRSQLPPFSRAEEGRLDTPIAREQGEKTRRTRAYMPRYARDRSRTRANSASRGHLTRLEHPRSDKGTELKNERLDHAGSLPHPRAERAECERVFGVQSTHHLVHHRTS